VSQYYPVALDLRDRACLVVGGGPVAEAKVERVKALRLHTADERVELGEDDRVAVSRGGPGCPRLNGDTKLDKALNPEMLQCEVEAEEVSEHVARLLEQRHAVLGTPLDADETERLENAKRLPDGRSRDSERGRELTLRGEPVACAEMAVGNCLLELFEYLLEGAQATDRLQEGRGLHARRSLVA